MATPLEQLLLNLASSVHKGETLTIAGGDFSPAEIQAALDEIATRLPDTDQHTAQLQQEGDEIAASHDLDAEERHRTQR